VAALVEGLIRAAGAVVWRRAASNAKRGEVEIALVHRPKYNDWSLPKGKLARGEHVLAAAVREVQEETGQRVALGRPLPTERYTVEGRVKEVHYWAATSRNSQGASFAPNREVDDVRWLPVDQAKALLTHPRDIGVVDALVAAPVRTVTIVLQRHGEARKRVEWTGDDNERPLTEAGWAQAKTLVDLLDAYGISRVLSSDARRCVDTVRPYAERHGLRIEIEPTWSEAGFAVDRATALAKVRPLLDGDQPTVVSGHREVLPVLVAQLCQGSEVPSPVGEVDAGAFWVLHAADGRVVAIEHHEPASPVPVSQLTQP
jgi:8-oxo-dGTP diphosphatase